MDRLYRKPLKSGGKADYWANYDLSEMFPEWHLERVTGWPYWWAQLIRARLSWIEWMVITLIVAIIREVVWG